MSCNDEFDIEVTEISERQVLCINGTEIVKANTAPDSPILGFGPPRANEPTNMQTIRQVVKFLMLENLENPDGDQSTPQNMFALNSHLCFLKQSK